VLPGLIAACALTALAATALPDAPPAPMATVPTVTTGAGWPRLARLACHPQFLLFLLGASAIQASHGVYYAFATLDWQRGGHGEAVIGGLWALGVLAEIVLFSVSGHAVRRFGPIGLLLLGACAGLLRWSGTALEPGLPALLLLQSLHAFTFGATHLGAMHFLTRAMPPDLAATGQGLLAAMAAGIMLGLATFAAGFLYEAFAARAYFAMAVLSALGGLAILALARRWNGSPLLA
jgi:PPP family 3-phenylpropionic acid transporter